MKKLLTLFAVLIIAAVALLASLPMLLSFGSTRPATLGLINSFIPGELHVDKMSVGWTSAQELEGLRLLDPDGQVVLSVGRIYTDASLVTLASGTPALGEAVVERPHLLLVQDESGESNIDEALGRPSPQADVDAPYGQIQIPFTGRIAIHDGRIELVQPDLEPIVIEQLNAELYKDGIEGPLEARLKARSTQGGLAGNMDVDAVVRGFDSYGRFGLSLDALGLRAATPGAEVKLTMLLEHIPSPALDRLLGRRLVTSAVGEEINMSMDHHLTSERWTVSGRIDAPRLKAFIAGDTTAEAFELKQPARIEFTVTPEFIEDFARLAAIEEAPRLQAALPLGAEVEILRIPLNGGLMDLGRLRTKTEFKLGSGNFTLPSVDRRFNLEMLEGLIQTAELNEGVQVRLLGRGNDGTQPARLEVNVDARQLIGTDGKASLENAEISAVVDAKQVPVALYDRLAGYDGELEALLGPALNTRITAGRESDSSALRGSLAVSSKHLNSDGISVEWDDGVLTLIEPTLLRARLTPDFVKRYLPETELLAPSDILVDVATLEAPYDLDSGFDMRRALRSVNGQVNIQELRLQQGELKRFLLQMEEGAINLRADLDASELSPKTRELLDLPLQLSGELQPQWGDAALRVDDVKFRIQSALLAIEAAGSIDENQVLHLKDGATGSYRIDPDVLARAGFGKGDAPRLVSPSTVRFQVAPTKLPLSGFDINTLVLNGSGGVTQLKVARERRALYATLERAALDWDVDFAHARASLNLRGQASAQQEDTRGELVLKLLAQQWWKEGKLNPENSTLQAVLNLDRFPVALLAAASGEERLLPLFGETLALQSKASFSKLAPITGQGELQLRGDAVSFDAALSVADDVLQLNAAPAQFRWTLTPGRFQALHSGSLELAEACQINMDITQLMIPRYGTSAVGTVRQVALEASGSLEGLHIRDRRSRHQALFEELRAELRTQDLAKETLLQLRGTGRSSESAQLRATVDGRFLELVDAEGRWNFKQPSSELAARLENFPAAMLSSFAGLGSDYALYTEAAFGNVLNASMDLTLQRGSGGVKAELASDNSYGVLDGSVERGVLTLKRPITGKLRVTPALSATLLNNVNPIFLTAVSAQEPVELLVDPRGFSVPILPLDLGKAQMGRGSLTLGKLRVKNGGSLGALLSLFSNRGLRGREETDAWFTPQYFSMRNGVLKLERMDFLVDNQFHLCTWGNVDFPADRIDMVAGINEGTLRRTFGVNNLPDSYVLRAPIRGSIGEARPSVGGVLAQIATLKAGGGIGQIFGQVIGGGNSAPRPTVNPIPWAELFERAEPRAQEPPEEQEQQQQEERSRNLPERILRDIFKP